MYSLILSVAILNGLKLFYSWRHHNIFIVILIKAMYLITLF